MRIRKNLIIVLAALVLAGCASTGNVKMDNGAYTIGKDSAWYKTQRGVLYANDGQDWYYLVQPIADFGFVRGAPTGAPEKWCKVGGSRVKYYMRTPFTFRDTTLQPVFIGY